MGRPLVSKYVTVGFDSEARAKKFIDLIEGNGLLIKLYETFVDADGQKKGKINSVQARSCHEWTPSTWERRRFEFGGVTLEFKDQLTAAQFLHYVMGFLAGEYSVNEATDGTEGEPDSLAESSFHEAATALAMLLKPENVFGAKVERD